MTISRVKFPWPPFFRIFIFFDEIFNTARGPTYLMRDDGATVVNVRSSRVIWSFPNPTDVLAQPCTYENIPSSDPVVLLGALSRAAIVPNVGTRLNTVLIVNTNNRTTVGLANNTGQQ